MLQGITNRLPAVLVNAINQAVYLGSTYACLSLLAALLGSIRLGRTPRLVRVAEAGDRG